MQKYKIIGFVDLSYVIVSKDGIKKIYKLYGATPPPINSDLILNVYQELKTFLNSVVDKDLDCLIVSNRILIKMDGKDIRHKLLDFGYCIDI